MGRLLVLAVVVVGVAIAMPWVAATAAVVALLVAVSAAGTHRGQRRRFPAPVPARPPLTLERRVALRRAWRDLHGIEATSGLPPTPPRI